RVQNAIIEVPLRTPSDLVLTIVGQMLSLIPGSLLIEARRSTHTIYLHILDVADATDCGAAREHALALEARVVRALGVDLASGTTDQRSPR
ncbi:Na+/H+ antiporter subunit E, partial [Nocardioides sp.]|uniref:Na+/H+ antiporter subunit E n=1 Tax=Nocardioides sp. TaxID=35761 RepID=UPI002736484B